MVRRRRSKFATRELARRVREALARLAEPEREILMLRNFEGLSLQEIACVLDIDPAAARKRHGRALLRLRKELIDDGLRFFLAMAHWKLGHADTARNCYDHAVQWMGRRNQPTEVRRFHAEATELLGLSVE